MERRVFGDLVFGKPPLVRPSKEHSRNLADAVLSSFRSGRGCTEGADT